MFDGKTLHSCRFDLGEMPTIERLRKLFYDLYGRYLYEPDYLFLAEQDHATLTRAINDDLSIMRRMPLPPMTEALPRDYFLSTAIARLCLADMGSSIHVVSLPGLEPGSVILGFFK